MSELKTRYQTQLVPSLKKEWGVTNNLAVPKVDKIVINVGVPKTEQSQKEIETVMSELEAITGQRPRTTRAKKAVAGFGIRQGDPVGVSVTLRGEKMFDFLEKLCRIVLPQVKDFKGVSRRAFDGHGNYTLGLAEQIIFPEIEYTKVSRVRGLEITITTTAGSDEHAAKLLAMIGMPFESEGE